MKKCIVLFMSVLFVVFILSGCEKIGRYNVDWIIGKDANEIQSRYGKFDGHPQDIPDDGLYKNCTCSYSLPVGHQLFGDPLPEEFLYIYFDDAGIAYKVYKYVEPAG